MHSPPKVCGSGPGLSLWNLPASECVSSISTSAPALDVIFDDNQASQSKLTVMR